MRRFATPLGNWKIGSPAASFFQFAPLCDPSTWTALTNCEAGVSRLTPAIGAVVPVSKMSRVAPASIVLRNSFGRSIDSG